MAEIYMHHNYFTRSWPLDYAFQMAKEYGYDGIEVTLPRDDSETESYVRSAKGSSDKHELPGVSFAAGCNVIMSDKKARRAAAQDLIKKLRLVKRVFGPGHVVNTGVGGLRDGSATADEVHYERAAEAYKQIGEAAAKLGLSIVFEIHMGTLHDTAKSTAKLLDMIGSPVVKANLDFGNMFLTAHAEKKIPEFMPLLKGKIGYFHVKNYYIPFQTQARVLTLLAEGDIDHSYLLQHVYDLAGYRGIITPEHPWPGDGHYSGPRDLAYLREITARIGW